MEQVRVVLHFRVMASSGKEIARGSPSAPSPSPRALARSDLSILVAGEPGPALSCLFR